jgi:hypothetical protein
MIVSMSLYLLASIFGAVFATNPPDFGVAFLAHTIISGIYFTSMASVGQRLYPKLKFAQFASARLVLQAGLGMLVLPPLMGLILDASGHNYRLTFISGGILAALGLVALLVVYRQFLKLGGPSNYVAPLSNPTSSRPLAPQVP